MSLTSDDVAAIRADVNRVGGWHETALALCDALEQAWAERVRQVNEVLEQLQDERERAERAEAYAVLMTDKRAEAQLRMRDVAERAERAEAEAEYWKHCYELERDALARVRELLPETCGAPYCGPCHGAIREIRAAMAEETL